MPAPSEPAIMPTAKKTSSDGIPNLLEILFANTHINNNRPPRAIKISSFIKYL